MRWGLALLLGSAAVTGGVLGYVHWEQRAARERMWQGVVRDLERQQARREQRREEEDASAAAAPRRD